MDEWLGISFSDEIKEGKMTSVKILNEEILIGRIDGKVFALSNRCLHRGAKLSSGKIKNRKIDCPYHGWEYETDGRLSFIPSSPKIKPPEISLRKFEVKEAFGIIWLKFGNPNYAIENFFPEYNDTTFRIIPCGPYVYKNSATRVVENLIDVSHFPFVHEGLLGDPSYPEIPDYDVEITKEGVVAKEIKIYQPNPDGTGKGRYTTYTYKALRPLIVYFTKKDEENKAFSMLFSVTPINEEESLVLALIAMNYGFEIPAEKIREFEDTVMQQDMKVLEEEEPKYLPLDLKREIHSKADKMSIYYRKWLKEIGFDCCVK